MNNTQKDLLFSEWYEELLGTKSEGFAYKVWCAGWENASKIERDKFIKYIEEYQIPVGNSQAGVLAAEYTINALKDIRDEIKARKT